MTRWIEYVKFNRPLVRAYKETGSLNFILVDGGAAGALIEPFNVAKSVITSIRFEPRGAQAVLKADSDIYIDGGLWSEDTDKILHIGYDPSTSSICEPNNEFLKNFDDNFGIPKRKTVNKIKVRVRSIDSCLKQKEIPLPNFIKLDVHSAELPALMGSSGSLKNCVGLLVETWHSEVHLKQGLHYEIEEFAIKNGFEVYDIVCAARWKIKHKDQISDVDKGRYIGSEILFIKKNVDENLRLHKAFVLAMFGFYNDAKNSLGSPLTSQYMPFYQAIEKVQLSIKKSLVFKLKKIAIKIVSLIT